MSKIEEQAGPWHDKQDQLFRQLGESQFKISCLKNQLLTRDKQIGMLEQSFEKLQNDFKSHNATLRQLRESREEEESLRKQLSTAVQMGTDLEREIKNLQAQIEANKLAHFVQVNDLQEKNEQARGDFKRVSANAISLQRQLKAEKKNNAELQRYGAEKQHKSRTAVHGHDEDDEEVVPRALLVKLETARKKTAGRDMSVEKAGGTNSISTFESPVAYRLWPPPYAPQKAPEQHKRKRDESGHQDSSPGRRSKTNAPQKNTKRSTVQSQEYAHNLDTDLANFTYTAVVNYAEDIAETYTPEEIPKDLWHIVQDMQDAWDDEFGANWHFRVTDSQPSRGACCVTTKLRGGRTNWRADCVGTYACASCVLAGKPCFSWDGEKFWMLPLHEQDRQAKVVEGFEIRHWINERESDEEMSADDS